MMWTHDTTLFSYLLNIGIAIILECGNLFVKKIGNIILFNKTYGKWSHRKWGT